MFEDFFGQFFAIEKVTARMVNNIDGAIIGDFQVNFYIYILLAIIAAIAIGYELYKYNRIVFKEAKFIIFISLFVCWGALEFRSTLQYISYTSDDIHSLADKTLDEKRAVVSPTGMGEFVSMIKKHVKNNETIVLYAPKDEYIWIKLQYWLAPIKLIYPEDKKTGDFTARNFVTNLPSNAIDTSSYGWLVKNTNKELSK